MLARVGRALLRPSRSRRGRLGAGDRSGAARLALYERDVWGAERGLPGGGVHAIAQGKDGYLWLGTDAGSSASTGRSSGCCRACAARSGAASSVLGVEVDDEGSVWLRLDAPTLLRYRDGRFEDVPFGAHAPRGGDHRDDARAATASS